MKLGNVHLYHHLWCMLKDGWPFLPILQGHRGRTTGSTTRIHHFALCLASTIQIPFNLYKSLHWHVYWDSPQYEKLDEHKWTWKWWEIQIKKFSNWCSFLLFFQTEPNQHGHGHVWWLDTPWVCRWLKLVENSWNRGTFKFKIVSSIVNSCSKYVVSQILRLGSSNLG